MLLFLKKSVDFFSSYSRKLWCYMIFFNSISGRECNKINDHVWHCTMIKELILAYRNCYLMQISWPQTLQQTPLTHALSLNRWTIWLLLCSSDVLWFSILDSKFLSFSWCNWMNLWLLSTLDFYYGFAT